MKKLFFTLLLVLAGTTQAALIKVEAGKLTCSELGETIHASQEDGVRILVGTPFGDDIFLANTGDRIEEFCLQKNKGHKVEQIITKNRYCPIHVCTENLE